MEGIKALPQWIHDQIKEMDTMWGPVDGFRKKARLDHRTFKRLVKKGYGATHVVQRVISAIEADKEPTEITGQMIIAIVEKRKEAILALLPPRVSNEAVPNQLKAWIMNERDMKRKEISTMLGYSSPSWVNHARQSIRNEMDINRDFESLVFEIEEELERMGKA